MASTNLWRGRIRPSGHYEARRDILRAHLLNVAQRKPAGVNRALSTIATFCDWAIRQGLIQANPTEVRDPGLYEQIMRVNYLGVVYCTHAAPPHLKESRGLIVGISSLTGKTGVPTRSGYAASKHAMAEFLDTLRIELAPYGVGVTVIYPGFVATEVRGRAFRGKMRCVDRTGDDAVPAGIGHDRPRPPGPVVEADRAGAGRSDRAPGDRGRALDSRESASHASRTP